MPGRTEPNDQRWRLNASGQLVDADAAGWDLADELVRMKIAEVSGTPVDLPIRTPSKPKLPAGVAQFSADSPLDAASLPSSNSSPQSSEHQISISHSRGSSIDTTSSISSNNRVNRPLNVKPAPVVTEGKERPHSFSGGLSNADLRRLQQTGDDQQPWVEGHPTEQLSYPSLAHNHVHRPQPQQPPNMYGLRASVEETHQGYIQPGSYDAPAHHPSYPPAANGAGYRQPSRPFQQPMLPGASPLPYPTHTSHLSLGNTQQLYDMMLPGTIPENHHPAVNRVQQQHGVFRGAHHHSASDPSSLRDAAALALMNGNMQFAPGMFPPAPFYPNQYYGGQDVAAQMMAARLQPQYTGPYTPPASGQPPANMEVANPISPASTGTNGTQGGGPSANNRKLGLYKTELCRSWEEKGTCRYGAKCQFAHGEDELRRVTRHPKYKTEICRTFWVSGSCPYGKRCCFIHTELPSSGATPPAGSTPPADATGSHPDGRARSMSTNSDPNDASTSLLARLKNNNGSPSPGSVATPVDPSSNNTFQFSRPPTGSLRVDTSVLDNSSMKQQNKSAYPTFASNGIMLPAPEPIRAKSPAPVTAGPDLGRYNAARREIVGYNATGSKPGHGTRSNPRHSFSGEIDLGFSPSPPATGNSYGLSSPDTTPTTATTASAGRVNGHVRGGSAGNWSTLVRSNLANSAFPGSSAGDIMSASPWNDIAVGGSRQWS